jgi:hypothetical protein
VSFSNEDRPVVIQIVEALADAGVRVFFDGHVPLGERWEEVLDTSLGLADALLFCVGETTNVSAGQSREYESVVDRPDFSVIPVLLPGADTTTLPDFVRERQWLDLRSGVTEDGLKTLVSALRSRNRRA